MIQLLESFTPASPIKSWPLPGNTGLAGRLWSGYACPGARGCFFIMSPSHAQVGKRLRLLPVMPLLDVDFAIAVPTGFLEHRIRGIPEQQTIVHVQREQGHQLVKGFPQDEH